VTVHTLTLSYPLLSKCSSSSCSIKESYTQLPCLRDYHAHYHVINWWTQGVYEIKNSSSRTQGASVPTPRARSERSNTLGKERAFQGESKEISTFRKPIDDSQSHNGIQVDRRKV